MRFDLKQLWFILLFFAVPALAQDSVRWLSLNKDGSANILRHDLQKSVRHIRKFRLNYETEPVSPLLKFINKNFPEIGKKASDTADFTEFENTAILLEKLKIEAEEINETASDTVATESESLF